MSVQLNNVFNSVLSINPYTQKFVSGVSGFLSEVNLPEYSKEQFVCSYINTQKIINNQIEVSKNIPDEDILDTINIKIYDELGLDQATEYYVQYIETFHNLDTENRRFQVFIVDPLDIAQTYEDVVKQIKYIDYITPSPVLIKALYSKNIIQENGVHCFIYFEENDAFVAVYNEKEFVYTKSLKYSLSEMHERFCELYGEKIDFEDFLQFLTTQNLKYTQSDFKPYIFKLYKEIFANINDILTYAKKAYELDKIEHIYVGSQIDIASKLYEIAEVELSIASSDFNFEYGFDTNGKYFDQIDALMHLNALLTDEERYQCNFSQYHRPPKFTKRESGKFLILVAASLFLAFIYPMTYWTLYYMQDLQYKLLENTYNETHAEKITREATIKSKEAEKANALALLKEEQDNYNSKKNTLITIHEVKVNYPMKAKLMSLLTKDLNKYAIKLDGIKYTQENDLKNFTFSLLSPKDKEITQLIEYLTKIHNREFKFTLEDIIYNEEKKLYTSELKVQIL